MDAASNPLAGVKTLTEPLCVRMHFSDGATTPVVKDRLPVGAPSNVLHAGGRGGSSI